MMSSLARRGALAALITVTSIGGCKCGSKVTTAGTCSSDSECVDQNGGNDRWFCDKTKTPPVCALKPKQCDTSADCCPGQVCNVGGHFCFDKYTPCSVDGTCPATAQVCQTIGVFAKGQGCTFNKCATDGSCASGTSCFNKYCVGEPPCNGGCSNGKVCITATNLCSPPPADGSCKQSCPNGKMLVLTNPDNIFDLCNPASETCECDSLPPLQTRDVARYSSLAVSGSTVFVSAYDGEYGGLVVHTFDKGSLAAPQKSQWVDGVPATGHIGGDLNGPRGGITDVGPDVGRYTSIAASAAGDLYVAYYDNDNGDLKFAARYGGPLAPWSVMTVDGSTPVGSTPTNGDLGLFTSIALMQNGTPAIAYFRRGSYDNNAKNEQGTSTALLYAVATKVQPQVAADWKVIGAGNLAGADVDTLIRPPPPCNNGCKTSELCIDDPNAANGQRCAVATTGCSPACVGTNLCVKDSDVNGTPVCRTTEAAAILAELPQGTGLMPSLAFMDDHPVIAYYDSVNRAVKAVQGSGTGLLPSFAAPVEIDGHDTGAGAVQRDTGRFPALAISANPSAPGGRIAIAFGDRTSQQLVLYQSNGLTAHAAHAQPGAPGLIHLVDDGRPAAGDPWHPQSLPGAQTSIVFTPSGKIALAYQDATPVNLMLASYDPVTLKTVSRSTVRMTGSTGFYPHLALDQTGAAFVSSATIKEAPGLLPANRLTVDQVAAP